MVSESNTDALSSLVVNADALEAIQSEIASNAESSIPQPVMIIGQEGSGKTTLLRRLYQACAEKICIWIDGRYVFSSDYIIDLCTQRNSSIVFIDDIDYYLSRCSYDEQFKLRRYLYNEGAAMLIASASKVMPALVEYNAPFFEGLKKIYLNSVSKDNFISLFDGSSYERALSMFEVLSPTIKSLKLIYYIIEMNDIPSKDISILISFFSDKFKNIYKNLPTYSQHILNSVGAKDNGMVMSEIREDTKLPTNILSVYLKTLREIGIISADKSIRKNTRYAVKDPLFRIWLTKYYPL